MQKRLKSIQKRPTLAQQESKTDMSMGSVKRKVLSIEKISYVGLRKELVRGQPQSYNVGLAVKEKVPEVFEEKYVSMMKVLLGHNREYIIENQKESKWSELKNRGQLSELWQSQKDAEIKKLNLVKSGSTASSRTSKKPDSNLMKKTAAGFSMSYLPTPQYNKIKSGKIESMTKKPKELSDQKKIFLINAEQPYGFEELKQLYQSILEDGFDPDFTIMHPICPNVHLKSIEINYIKNPNYPKLDKRKLESRDNQKQNKLGVSAQTKPPVKVCTTFSKGEFKLFRYFFEIGEWTRVERSKAKYVHYTREIFTEWDVSKSSLISTIPGLELICRKKNLGKIINSLRKLYPFREWYMPETFVLPEDYSEYCSVHTENKERVYIAKISGGCQGVGVRILIRPSDLPPRNTVKSFDQAVVQRYIQNPLLLNNFKQDLRLYLLIAHSDPPIVYLNEEGLARFCTNEYVEPQMTGKIDAASQLTNYSLNKKNGGFKTTDELFEENEGSKRTLSSYWKGIAGAGIDPNEVRSKIVRLLQHLIKAIQPYIKLYSSKHFQYGDTRKNRMMHLLGADVLIDAQGEPWLLELNSMPSMAVEVEEGHQLKPSQVSSSVSRVDFFVKSQYFIDNLEWSGMRLDFVKGPSRNSWVFLGLKAMSRYIVPK